MFLMRSYPREGYQPAPSPPKIPWFSVLLIADSPEAFVSDVERFPIKLRAELYWIAHVLNTVTFYISNTVTFYSQTRQACSSVK